MGSATRTAVITGAASGIGRATALRLLHDGCDVLAVDRERAGLDELALEGCRTLAADLRSERGRDDVVDRGAGASMLINSAGIILLKPILDVQIKDLRDVYAVNVEAVWDLTSRIGRTVPSGGAIVNVSSSSAKLASTVEAAVYASSKVAVLSVTRSFAYAFAPEVRVNAICPGIVDTAMQDAVLAQVGAARGIPVEELSQARTAAVPLGRAATADECAGVISFLLSEAAAYMTGQAINYTGGLVMW